MERSEREKIGERGKKPVNIFFLSNFYSCSMQKRIKRSPFCSLSFLYFVIKAKIILKNIFLLVKEK